MQSIIYVGISMVLDKADLKPTVYAAIKEKVCCKVLGLIFIDTSSSIHD
jgi:hypothetical protein